MASSSKRKGSVRTIEWWKHLRHRKRDQQRLVRTDGKRQIETETDNALDMLEEDAFINSPMGWWVKGECPHCFVTMPSNCDCEKLYSEDDSE